MSRITSRTQVAIIGAGPAGSLLSLLLARNGIDSVVLERQSKDYVLSRIRAGVLEAGTADLLREIGLGDRMDREGFPHSGTEIAFDDRQVRVDFEEHTGRHVMLYGQTEVQKDLFAAFEERPEGIVFEAEDVTLDGITTERPTVRYRLGDVEHELECDWIAGCDGFHGPSRKAIPKDVLNVFERVYPFGWLGILSETPPVADELIYSSHARGFALCSMRNPSLSRYYIQCSMEDDLKDWSDERFWDELALRLPSEVSGRLSTGPSVEKSIAPLRSFIADPMRHGRLVLAGDSAHIVPPTGAKGLNLAVSDVIYLSRALVDHYAGSSTGMDEYSATALARVWKASRFSWWMTTLLHRFPTQDDFDRGMRVAEFEHLVESPVARASLAENYVGLPI